MKTFFWRPHQTIFVGKNLSVKVAQIKLFGLVWGNSGKISSQHQKFACFYTNERSTLERMFLYKNVSRDHNFTKKNSFQRRGGQTFSTEGCIEDFIAT